MVTEKNQMIYQIHLDHPNWTFQMISDLTGVSRQRVHQIVQQCQEYSIITPMENDNKFTNIKITEPISATHAAKLTGIPYGIISVWVSRGLVVKVKDSGRPRACTGHPVLLDHNSLQRQIDKYRPRQKKQQTTA